MTGSMVLFLMLDMGISLGGTVIYFGIAGAVMVAVTAVNRWAYCRTRKGASCGAVGVFFVHILFHTGWAWPILFFDRKYV